MSNRKKAERNFMECIIREWRIEDADGRVVGSIGVFQCDNIHFRTAEMGYYQNFCGTFCV